MLKTDIPCGFSIPLGNPHAVSVSFPKLSDVIRYEEQDDTIINMMQSGYPRFFQNRLVQQAVDFIQESNGIDQSRVFIPVGHEEYLLTIFGLLGHDLPCITVDGISGCIVERNSALLPAIKKILQNTGFILSSRSAEDFLLRQGAITDIFPEHYSGNTDNTQSIKNLLRRAYKTTEMDAVYLANTGMSSVYHVFEAINKSVPTKEKQIFLQLGWLYLDTMDILSKYGKSKCFLNTRNLETTLDFIKTNHQKIAAVFTEYPTNPLLHKADLPVLYKHLQSYNIPLIVDCSLGTAYINGILEKCDVVIESLTKFASGNADIMMGAIICSNSPAGAQISEQLKNSVPLPYCRNLQRIDYEMDSYSERVEKSCQNTKQFLQYLSSKKANIKVYSAPDVCVFGKELFPAPVISIDFSGGLESYYDKLQLAKGPSFGTTFTLAMPYTYLAHYGLIKTVHGRRMLKAAGLSPELLRVSVGTEPIEQLIDIFEFILD